MGSYIHTLYEWSVFLHIYTVLEELSLSRRCIQVVFVVVFHNIICYNAYSNASVKWFSLHINHDKKGGGQGEGLENGETMKTL